MRVQTNIEFTEMKKNKKESLKFTLKGDDSNGTGKKFYDMAGSIVRMEITGCSVGKFPAEFVDIKKSAKGVVANFLLKGDLSDEQSGQIYVHSGGGSVELTLEESQMTIEDFRAESHDGYDDEDDDDQLDMDEVLEPEGLDMDKVIAEHEQKAESEIEARARRKREAAEAKVAREAEQAVAVENQAAASPDDELF